MTSDESMRTALPLAGVLTAAGDAMWPRRAQQELLLDLGERKRWVEDDRRAAIEQAASWLVREVGLPKHLEADRGRGDEADGDGSALDRVRAVVGHGSPGSGVPGVAAWVNRIAPAVGASPKTLANSLAGPLRSDRADHRWLRALGRVLSGDPHLDAWCFHRRTPDAVTRALASLAARERFDALDALLVLSLMALWQRRRPTNEAKGNRGRAQSRRLTPKPVSALLGTLVQPVQAVALVELARRLDSGTGAALVTLALEATLTEAHLAPHPTRSSATTGAAGTQWLKGAEDALERGSGLLDEMDRDLFRFRLARLRAWVARRPQVVLDERLRAHPHVAATLALEARMVNPASKTQRFSAVTPGLFMLIPALRSKGMLEES